MNGQELFEKYRNEGLKHGYGSPQKQYAGILFTAFTIVGKEELFALLEEAERTGKRIALTSPIPIEEGPSDPCGAELI